MKSSFYFSRNFLSFFAVRKIGCWLIVVNRTEENQINKVIVSYAFWMKVLYSFVFVDNKTIKESPSQCLQQRSEQEN